ncbi:MAG: hypothetical protein JXR22_01040, partial [Prolixibacteraceae bacterium]|nr:hypothetical protein [Prolixibacteraceae bacterium]
MNHTESILDKTRQLIQSVNILVEESMQEILQKQFTFHQEFEQQLRAIPAESLKFFIPLNPSTEAFQDGINATVLQYHLQQIQLIDQMIAFHTDDAVTLRFIKRLNQILDESLFFAEAESLNEADRLLAKSHFCQLVKLDYLPVYFNELEKQFELFFRTLIESNLQQYQLETQTLFSGALTSLPESFPELNQNMIAEALNILEQHFETHFHIKEHSEMP